MIILVYLPEAAIAELIAVASTAATLRSRIYRRGSQSGGGGSGRRETKRGQGKKGAARLADCFRRRSRSERIPRSLGWPDHAGYEGTDGGFSLMVATDRTCSATITMVVNQLVDPHSDETVELALSNQSRGLPGRRAHG
ncbi:hypothetical protein JOF53_008564 [Crossiella equi]|uniref:Uncharacterized protein n=1 Tax=Crossiella equi TaxID=130796 RepID=A0ABS5ASZ0_9PSEU|nr:hypothetical protein [Crossiella equi]MBP2479692.1 hypothetical protein [Crossiella equi]